MENANQKSKEIAKKDTSNADEKSSPNDSKKKETVTRSVTDNTVQTKSLETSTADQQKPEEILEDTSDSPFALQSLVDVPDFEFMGADGSYQTPFY